MNPHSALLGGLATLAVTSCASMDPAPAGGAGYLAGLGATTPLRAETASPTEASSFWDGDDVQGSPMIRIDRRKQTASFYKGDLLVGVAPISSGDVGYSTPAGTFKVTEMDIDHESSLYGRIINANNGDTIVEDADTRIHKVELDQKFIAAPMHYFMRFNGAIGMHAGHLPGYPASHGCVRLPRHMAQKFYEHAEPGMPVVVE